MSESDFYQRIAQELDLKAIQVAHTVELLDEGNTVPFIARYRKEATGKLDEEQIRAVEERIKYLRMLEERRQTILHSIDEQGKLIPELEAKIKATTKLQELEDLYLPYRPKKRTRATVARERGLEPLADLILKQETVRGDTIEIAAKFVDPKKEVNSPEEALAGARDIVAEIISDDAEVRKQIRQLTRSLGILNSNIKSSAKKSDERSEYEIYYDFSSGLKKIQPHQILAINRGEKEKFLSVSIEFEEEKALEKIRSNYIKNPNSIFLAELETAIRDSYKRLIAPAIEREVRGELTEKAEKHAINVFARNLKSLLLQPPVRGKIIMGIDPGFRTGCKVAVIDPTGKYLEGDTIFPHPPQNQVFESKTVLRKMIEKYNVDIVAVGNGTASRETETLVTEVIGEIKESDGGEVVYIIVNEAGASVYSASKAAKEEFPDLEASLRGNISIARRLLDPLAELVKIDPKHIGVGLYQHDVNQKKLGEALDAVVESAVNLVGVDLNTASASLLQNVSGLNSKTAEKIVAFRDENGRFIDREKLKEVSGIGETAFQQSAGFLRIVDGDNPLDNTAIHPESYLATKKLLEIFQVGNEQQKWRTLRAEFKNRKMALPEIAGKIGVGEPTLEDILINLEKPARDPRDEMPKPFFKSDVLEIDDLKEGMILQGTVRNVVDFGAFVDIGLKRDGLVHVSQMANKFVKNPLEIVSVGDIIKVKVIRVDLDRERVNLSMKIN
jgi:uncharacterized protein